MPLLRRLDAGDYPTQAGHIIGLGKQHTWYYIKKLEKCNLIHREKRSNVIIYELNEEGKKLLRSCEGTVFPAELYRFDKCQVSYEILSEGRYPNGSFRPVEMVNWTALLGTELGVKVKHTPRSWIVHVEVIQGRNAIEVTNLAMNLANRVSNALCSKYGCVLSDGRVIAGEIAHEDPIAALFGRYFTVRANNRKIDHSWGPGELEHTQRDAVVSYLQMPEGVKKIEVEVTALRGEVAALRTDLNLLTSALKEIFGLDSNGAQKASMIGGKEYVT